MMSHALEDIITPSYPHCFQQIGRAFQERVNICLNAESNSIMHFVSSKVEKMNKHGGRNLLVNK